jgi:hypothetical protein
MLLLLRGGAWIHAHALPGSQPAAAAVQALARITQNKLQVGCRTPRLLRL